MDNYEFYSVILDNLNLFIAILIVSFILHYFLFKYQVSSVLDPYFLPIISSVFCLADVVLLYLTENITGYVFASYLLTQISFVLGLYTWSIKRLSFQVDQKKAVKNVVETQNKEVAFYFFSFVYLTSQGLIYILKGIPLFMQSRLETFAEGGGSGVLGRITDVTSIFSLYLFFAVLKVDRFRISELPKYFILGLIFVTFLLSGGKSNFLVVFSVFWSYILFAVIKKKDYMTFLRLLRNNMKVILTSSLVVVSLIILVQTNSQVENVEDRINPLLLLGIRFVHSGDVYWYAYANDVYLQIHSEQWFAALFLDPLGFLRLVSWENLPEAIGITLKNIHHPSDIPSGPNARHNVFGLIYYGFYGSILFSYILGLTLGFVRNRLPYLLKGNILGGYIFTYLLIKSASIDTDPMLAMTYMTNLVFIFPIIYLFYLAFVATIKTNTIKNE